jgi:DNA-binding NtrC family response regulator
MLKKSEYQILAVDDSNDTLELIRRILKGSGYKIITVTNVIDATKILENSSIDLVITDLQMPEINGHELIKHIKDNYTQTGILVITAYPSIKNAVESVKLGADDYLIKSFTKQELLDAVEKSLKNLELGKKNAFNQKQSHSYGIIGSSENMKKVFESIDKASKIRATVLLNGETGTGKELVARAVHYSSREASSPFIAVNCGGIPENLLESELFGFVKGAFTGASETRGGFFQAADGGSIFLDEIHNTSMAMQAKLLRVIQEKEINMIGSNRAQKVDVRIIAAANVELMQLVKKDLFREDLYYRLNIIPIQIPPLRNRKEDIPELINYFNKKYSKELGIESKEFSKQVYDAFHNYDWPGNVRELENIIYRLVAMTDNPVIKQADLPHFLRLNNPLQTGIKKTLKQVEAEHIKLIMALVNDNKSQAARILDIDRKTLREKLKSLEDKKD